MSASLRWADVGAALERGRPLELDAAPGVGMDEGECLGMQREALGGAAVQPVADDRGAEAERVGGVDAELVAAAGARHEVDAGARAGAIDDVPVGDRRLAVLRVDDLARPVVEVDAERE